MNGMRHWPWAAIAAAVCCLGSVHVRAAETGAASETKEQRDARMHWWREAKFGMFIHWGVYSVPAGTYDGKQIPGIGEWIMNHGKIPVAEYAEICHPVQPDEVQRRRVGPHRQERRHELHGDHLEAPRRLRDVSLRRQPLQHLRRHSVQTRPAEGAVRGMRRAGHQAGILLLSGPGLAPPGRRGGGRPLGQGPGRRHGRTTSTRSPSHK